MALIPSISNHPGRRRRTKRKLRKFKTGDLFTGTDKPVMRSKDAIAIALSKTDSDPKTKSRKKKRKPVLVGELGTRKHGAV